MAGSLFPASLKSCRHRPARLCSWTLFLPENGDTIQKLTGVAVQDAIRAAMQRGDLGVRPRPAEPFGGNAAARDWVDSLCVPQPIGTFTSPIALSGARERIARKTYIRA